MEITHDYLVKGQRRTLLQRADHPGHVPISPEETPQRNVPRWDYNFRLVRGR